MALNPGAVNTTMRFALIRAILGASRGSGQASLRPAIDQRYVQVCSLSCLGFKGDYGMLRGSLVSASDFHK